MANVLEFVLPYLIIPFLETIDMMRVSTTSKTFYNYRDHLKDIVIRRSYDIPPEFQDLLKYNVLARYQYFLLISTSLVNFLNNKIHLHSLTIKEGTWLAAINWVLMNHLLPRIENLHVDSCFTSENISELSFYNYPQLQKITITNMEIEKKCLKSFFDNMCKFKQKHVKELHMIDNCFTYSGHGVQPSFLNYFRSNMFANLIVLNISHSSYLSLVDIGYSLNEGLAQNIEQLILYNCNVDNLTVEFIGSACLKGHLKKLKKINLSSNHFDVRRFQNFFLSITNGICIFLEEINLLNIQFNIETASFIDHALRSKNLQKLQYLHISGYLENVMKNLIHCPSLKKLEISSYEFRYNKQTIQNLFDLNLTHLESLDISSIGILDNLKDFKIFLEMLGGSKLCNLKEIKLCYKKTCKSVIKKFALFLETKCLTMKNVELCRHSSKFKPDVDFFKPINDVLRKRLEYSCNNVI